MSYQTASFRLPLENSPYFVDESIDIAIAAKDLDGTIAQVEILLNGTSIAILNSKPYLFRHEIKNIQQGDYNLELVGTDDQGGERSDVRVINVLPDEEFTDTRDGNTYRYVTIGNQTWIADNLAFLSEVYPPTEGSESIPHYYVYGYDGNDISAAKQTENYSKFGVMYNWEAAKQASPEGWHLPTESEWKELSDFMANDLNESDLDQHLLRTGEDGTNHYGFSAVLAGYLEGPTDGYWFFGPSDPRFSELGYTTSWWSCSYDENIENGDGTQKVLHIDQGLRMGWEEDTYVGLSVRCIKD